MTEAEARWFNPTQAKERAVAILAHGLNLKPERMDSLARLIQNAGASALRISLSGHRGDLEELKQVSLRSWMGEAERAYHAARERADRAGVPLHLVGYSMGALLYANLILAGKARFDSVVLFSPAFSPKPWAGLVRIFEIFGGRFTLPSLSPPLYRANRATSMAAYRALFEAFAELSQAPPSELENALNLPTLVVIDPKDELVSAPGLRRFAENAKLGRWRFLQVDNKASSLAGKFHHLIIDELALGSEQWLRVQDSLLTHLNLETERAKTRD